MNINELEKLKKVEEKKALVTAKDLENQENRTLLYGYDCERDTWHTYLKDGEIITVIYPHKSNVRRFDVQENEHFVPNKRLYPESCDYEFCKLLKESGVYLPFTTYDENVEKVTFYGKVLF